MNETPQLRTREPGVVVASFRSPAEERLAREALEAEGIEGAADDDTTLGDGWRCISVRTGDAGRALDVLRALWPADEVPEHDAAPERCPGCGSPSVRRVPRVRLILAATLLLLPAGAVTGEPALFGLTFAIFSALVLVVPNRRCPECGERWQAVRAPVEVERAVETPDVLCPRCGSCETVSIDRRRERALTLLVNFLVPPVVLLWPFLPTRRCGECNHEWR